MYYCNECDRSFGSYNSIQQHYQNSRVHSRPQSPSPPPPPSYYDCPQCDRTFVSENNFRAHLNSRAHLGANMECPFCKQGFVTASGVTIHLESGTCSSGLNRQKINTLVRRLDTQNVITRPMITMPGYDTETIATGRAWNGHAYECYLCPREFGSLNALNQHLRSPAHEQKLYRCPGRGCAREYKLLSGLIQHVESESCGLMRFAAVQRQAKSGIENMVGRMITG